MRFASSSISFPATWSSPSITLAYQNPHFSIDPDIGFIGTLRKKVGSGGLRQC